MNFIKYTLLGLLISYVLYQIIDKMTLLTSSDIVSIGLVISSILCGGFGVIVETLNKKNKASK